MHYHDPIYGPVDITEPVLLDLMASNAVQRLRGIRQHGISGLIGVTGPISRYAHSLGVMLLVRRMGAPLAEQIAALLHDVSHTAFSHVIDYVFDNHEAQGYHDELKAPYLAGTDVPGILAGHGCDWRDFLDEAAYPLLEQPLPRLCADRLDYFFRDTVDLGIITRAECLHALDHLTVHDSRIVTSDRGVARWLGENFIAADDAAWANFREVGLYELTAQAIKTGLRLGVISRDDLWLTDEVVWARLHAASDPELRAQLALVALETGFVWDEDAPDFYVSTKIRAIDPDVLEDGQLWPLSALDADFAEYRADYLRRKAGKWPVRVIPPGTNGA